jgi:sulfur carrier protein
MKITLNSKPETIEGRNELTVSELLQVKNFTFKMLVVRINNKGIPKEDYDQTIINDGDEVLVLHLISGG